MGVSSVNAALKSFALILARTEARSGASREVMVSTASAPLAPRGAPASMVASNRQNAEGLMTLSLPSFARSATGTSTLHDGKRVARAVLLDPASPREREMVA